MEYWLSALFIMMENISMIFFFDAFFERKRRGKAFWGILLFFTVISYAIVNLLQVRISFLKLFLMLFVLLLINLFLYHGAFAMRILVVVSYYACEYILQFLSDNCVLWVLHISYEEFIYNRALYTAVVVGVYFLQIFLAALLKRFRRPRDVKKHPWAGATLIFPLASLGLLVPLHTVLYNYEQAVPLLVGFSATLVAVDTDIVVLIDWLEQSELMRQRALAVSERLAAQEQSVEALSAAYAAQRKMTHDFRNHLAALSGLLAQDPSPAAAQYIEACAKLEPPERWIEVRALLDRPGAAGDGTLLISVLNASPPVKIVNDCIETTKEDPALHGFGLPNVKELLSKNGAEYVMDYQNHAFQFSLEWPDAAH